MSWSRDVTESRLDEHEDVSVADAPIADAAVALVQNPAWNPADPAAAPRWVPGSVAASGGGGGGDGPVCGTDVIPDTESDVEVAHGMSATPLSVVATAREVEPLGITARDDTTFTVARAGTTGDLTFDWIACGEQEEPPPVAELGQLLGSAFTQNDADSGSVPMPAGVVPGCTLLLVLFQWSNGTSSEAAAPVSTYGFSLVGRWSGGTTNSTPRITAWVKQAGASEPSSLDLTWSSPLSGKFHHLALLAYSGAPGTPSADLSSNSGTTDVTTRTLNHTATGTAAPWLLFNLGAFRDSNSRSIDVGREDANLTHTATNGGLSRLGALVASELREDGTAPGNRTITASAAGRATMAGFRLPVT